MARPRKWRRVCRLPNHNAFGPVGDSYQSDSYIVMSVEEYETIRLMDLEGLNQEQSANVMGVARSTIQRIYDEARKKIADSLVNGKTLKIEGGDYKVCSDSDKACFGNCYRHGHGRRMRTNKD